MTPAIAKYRKFLVAVAGAVLVGLSDFFAVTLPFAPEQLVDQVIAVGTALGVWAVPNGEA